MKRLAAISTLCLLFSTAFGGGENPVVSADHPDSLRSVYSYTEGLKQLLIAGDSVRAKEFFEQAIEADSAYAPAYYQLAANNLLSSPTQTVAAARHAYQLDTTNKWYLQFYGQALLLDNRYDEALGVYRRLQRLDAKDPNHYRLLSLLYEQNQQPFSAIMVLDSAELRFGRIPMLSTLKRRLLIATRQFDKAVTEARAMIDAVPFEPEHHVVLAELYGAQGKDSLAYVEFMHAMQIDSTNVETLVGLSEYYNRKQDYRGLLSTTKRLFMVDEVPLETKIRRFEQLTSDRNFYRDHFYQLRDLASTLAIRYPRDKQVVELYAGHLIASGELEQALALYKLHLDDTPPEQAYFQTVIDIESYLQRRDSVNMYIDRALTLFPEKTQFRIAKGSALAQSKQYSKAIQAYKESLRYADSDSVRGVIWGIIGDTWHLKAEAEGGWKNNQGRTAVKQCYKAYDRSLRYYKDNALVMNNYAYFLSEAERDLEKAFAMSSRVIELTGNNPTYLDTHAWVLFKMGRTAEARKFMQQAVALDSTNSPELYLHYGDIFWALGEKYMAQVYWRKALENGHTNKEGINRRLEQSKKP